MRQIITPRIDMGGPLCAYGATNSGGAGEKDWHFGRDVSMGLIAASGLIIGALYTHLGPEGVLISVAVFIHETSVTASYWLIGLHIAAALYHRYLRDGVWSAMVPIWRE